VRTASPDLSRQPDVTRGRAGIVEDPLGAECEESRRDLRGWVAALRELRVEFCRRIVASREQPEGGDAYVGQTGRWGRAAVTEAGHRPD
jgi:hypothetical protein